MTKSSTADLNTVIKSKLSHLIFVLILALHGCSSESDGLALQIGAKEVVLEVAASTLERAEGLSKRSSLQSDHGMVFVYQVPTHTCFWMHETFIELDAAFISPEGEFIKIVTMQPQTRERHCSPEAALWVIELAGGWFASNEVTSGDSLSRESLAKLRTL